MNWRYRQFHGNWLERGGSWLLLITSLPALLAMAYGMSVGEMPIGAGLVATFMFAYGIVIGSYWLVTNRESR